VQGEESGKPASPGPAVSVVVPAHNEAAVVGRLLSGLLAEAAPGEFEVLVVANGCTDGTEEVAATFAPRVRVLSTPEPNKHRAMRLADESAECFPRLYVDADVELSTASVRALAEALAEPGVFAVGPERNSPMDGRPWTVRWYYEVWHQLPVVRAGLFGRGVVGISREAYQRIGELPEFMGDDLAASLAFPAQARRVVPGAVAVVHPPRTLRDLIRMRIRALVSTTQIAGGGELSDAAAEARTTRGDLTAVLRAGSVLDAPKVAWFVTVTLIVRFRARRTIAKRDYRTWLRDESSRLPAESADARR
jgi:glycosyltransferase involved in cell wall biosynthesis